MAAAATDAPGSGGEAAFALEDTRVTMVVDEPLRSDLGTTLKLMDRAACLSAELLARAPCVTLSMDDLKVFQACPPTHRVVVTSEVTRAFNTSMEVLVVVEGVDHDRLHASTTSRVPICQSFFTFVALGPPGPDGKRAKVRLRDAAPRTAAGRANHRLAAERRTLRFSAKQKVAAAIACHADAVGPLGGSLWSGGGGGDSDDAAAAVAASAQRGSGSDLADELDFTMHEIVFPQHTQHHGTTFGGVIMSWAVTCAVICGERYARAPVEVRHLDEVVFREPSTTGDRMMLRARVNHSEGAAMEVGVRVEAWAVGGEHRHINSIFIELRSARPLRPLASLVAAPDADRVRRFAAALGRREVRSLRSSLGIRSFPESVELTDLKLHEICHANVVQALRLRASPFDAHRAVIAGIDVACRVEDHPEAVDGDGDAGAGSAALQPQATGAAAAGGGKAAPGAPAVHAAPAPRQPLVFLQLSVRLPPSAGTCEDVVAFLTDVSRRSTWDSDVETYEVHRRLPETVCDDVVRMVRRAGDAGQPAVELVLLRSVRRDAADGAHIVAHRSVELPGEATPPPPPGAAAGGFVRGKVSSASFFVEPAAGGTGVALRYIVHVPPAYRPADVVARLGDELPKGSWSERQFASFARLVSALSAGGGAGMGGAGGAGGAGGVDGVGSVGGAGGGD